MLNIILDTVIDSLKILPFLFIAFLLIELIEHKFKEKANKIIEHSGKLGPILGSVLGIVPQCGFSIAMTNLYVTRIISIGTLISVYLSTSDEMLPILLSEHADLSLIIVIILIKISVGIIYGYIIDLVMRKRKIKKYNYDICESDHCDCEHGIIKSTLTHTIKTIFFIFIIILIVNILFNSLSTNVIEKIFMKNNIFSPFLGSLIGLIPNCGASIVITELFLNHTINFGTFMAGLLTGNGVALLILFKSNKNMKENISILAILYILGAFTGILLEIFCKIIM